MKFKKINDTTVRCIISQEEMWEKGIEIDDFLEHKDKTEDFLRDIVEQARDELEMDGIGHAFSVQMSVMKTGELSLLIIEDEDEDMQRTLENFRERLQGFQEALQEARKMAEEHKHQEEESVKEETQTQPTTGQQNVSEEESKKEGGENTTYGDMPLWVILDSMDNILALCRHLSGERVVSSSLYKFDGQYYLRLKFAHRKKDITDAIMTLSEFCTFAFTEEQGGYAIAEHGQLIRKDDAVQVLSSL